MSIWVRPSILIGIALAIALLMVAAWIQFATMACPMCPSRRFIRTTSQGRMAFRSGCVPVISLVPVCDIADPQRPVHSHGSSTALFQ
jgi:hypothetical protein